MRLFSLLFKCNGLYTLTIWNLNLLSLESKFENCIWEQIIKWIKWQMHAFKWRFVVVKVRKQKITKHLLDLKKITVVNLKTVRD